jgi:beta-N-acetylhexosaminidase
MDQTLKHKIGQMIIAGFPSPYVDDQARRLVEDFHVGNFALFGRNYVTAQQVTQMCRDLHELVYRKNGYSAYLASDQEGGVVSRVCIGSALFPGTMAMAASPSADAYQVGKNCGNILGSMGILGNFAPVVDVNLDPMNPIIGSRSYSDEPETVARMGVDTIRGMHDGGMLATLKHYPGHGNVSTDSHLGLPRNSTPREELMRTEWMPFQRAIEAGADSIMTAHVVFEDVDPEHPATVSKAIMTDLLRGTMGFEGIAVTDCMEMDAIKVTYGIGPGAVMAVQAGCDVLCFSHTYEAVAEACNALYKAVEEGVITPERIDQSYNRIIRLKQQYNLVTPPPVDTESALRWLGDRQIMDFHAKISRDSMTLLYDNGGYQALKNAKNPRFFAPASIAVTGAEDKERAPTRFSDLAQQKFGGESIVYPMNEVDEATVEAIRSDEYDVAVLAVYNARFRRSQQEILRELEAQGKPLVVLMLGAPYDAPLIHNAQCVICAYEYTYLSANTLLSALETGEFPGHLPVKLPQLQFEP